MAHSHDHESDPETAGTSRHFPDQSARDRSTTDRVANVSLLHDSPRGLRAEDFPDEAEGDDERREPTRWEELADRVRFWFRSGAFIFFCCFTLGWPVGTSLQAYQRTGLLRLEFGLTVPIVAVVIALTALIFIIGQMLALSFRMIAKAEQLEATASRFAEPESHAVTNVRHVGQAVRAEITNLNSYLDEALVKLASAESMIRKQVQAIDSAGTSLQDGSGALADRVADERNQLIDLTERMNAEAEAFAEAIAEKAKLGAQASDDANSRYAEAEEELKARLTRLEETANQALGAFEGLSHAFEERRARLARFDEDYERLEEKAVETTASISKTFEKNTEAIAAAQAQLHDESSRLEELISQQRERADRLAEAISRQSDKLSDLSSRQQEQAALAAPTGDIASPRYSRDQEPYRQGQDAFTPRHQTPSPDRLRPQAAPASREERHSTSWRDILAAAEEPGRQAGPRRDTDPAPGEHNRAYDQPPSFAPPSFSPQGPAYRQATPLRLSDVATAPLPASPEQDRGQSAPQTPDTDNDVVWLIHRMQAFTVEMETQLFGEPDAERLTRYRNGERNIFANGFLRRDEADFRHRLRAEAANNEAFERAVFDFLENFDSLLEPDGDDEESDALIEDYLGSPLGQVYVLTGTTLDYFTSIA